MKTLNQARQAMEIMDQWFDSPKRKRRSADALNQIRGAHAALAWLFGKPIEGSADFDENIAALQRELPMSKSWAQTRRRMAGEAK